MSFFQMGMFKGSVTPRQEVSTRMPRRSLSGNPTLRVGGRGGNVDDRSGSQLDGAADANFGLGHTQFIVDRIDVFEMFGWDFVHG